jgi:hypothetical protein
MKTENKKVDATATATATATESLPTESLMKEAVALVKSNEKQQTANALFGGRVMESGFSFRFVVVEAMKRAGIEKRSLLESIVANSSPLIAPARLVARGEMTEKEFSLISPQLAKVAFKEAGGAKNGAGFDPDAWRREYAIAKKETEKSKEKTANTPAKSAPPLSAREFVEATIERRASELTNDDIDALVMKLTRLRK